MVKIDDICLEPQIRYSSKELRSIFGKSRAGKGIEELYDEDGNKYIRLFSKEESEYGDNLTADPMRYVGEKDFSNPDGNQVLNRGNGALAQSRYKNWPMFLFEKVSENPVRHLYHGQVEVVDFEHNYRPQKDKREYDFYLKLISEEGVDTDRSQEGSSDDLAPGPTQAISPEIREVPETEEQITYESNKRSQAEATNAHENTVVEICDNLESSRWTCMATDETDILATSDSEVLVIEVKSIDEQNEQRQIRKALGQLFENSYRDVKNRGWGDKELIQCLAFSQPPSDRFSGYLEFLQARDIEILWPSAEGVQGHPDSIMRIL